MSRRSPGTYWMLSFGLGFDEAQASNMVLVDDDLNLLEGDGMVNPSNRFHLWIYRHRPDVNAIIHTHPPYCSALSIVGVRKLSSLRRGKLKIRVTCPASCRVKARLITGRTVVASQTRTQLGAGVLTLRPRTSKKGRKLLRRKKKLKGHLVATTAVGTVTSNFTIKAPK